MSCTVLGLYGIANRHYDEIATTPGLELGAICDVNDTLASAWSRVRGAVVS